MKKRFLCAILAFVMLLMPLGCKARHSVSLPDADYALTIVEEYRKDGGNSLKLMYPEVRGYADPSAGETINRKAAELAFEQYRKLGRIADEDGGYVYTAMEALVLLSTVDFYCVYISGTVESEAGGDPEFFAYILNADLKNARFLTTEEIVKDYEKIRKSFLDGDFLPDFGTENPEENFTRQSLLDQYKSEYGIYPYVYFREGKIGLLLETLPSLGGCVGYQADIRDMSNCLNTDDPVIAMLCGME